MVTVRYFAGARAAAGVAEETAAARTVAELVTELEARRGAELAKVLAVAAYLVDGLACHNKFAELPADATVDVLPPFAGG